MFVKPDCKTYNILKIIILLRHKLFTGLKYVSYPTVKGNRTQNCTHCIQLKLYSTVLYVLISVLKYSQISNNIYIKKPIVYEHA